MIELKYTIPKINGKELTYLEVAILLGYTIEIESEKKEKVFEDKKTLETFAKTTLTAFVKDKEKFILEYTVLEKNKITPEIFVDLAFQNLIKENLFEILKKHNTNNVAKKLFKNFDKKIKPDTIE